MGNELSLDAMAASFGIDKDVITALAHALDDEVDEWDDEDDDDKYLIEEESSVEHLHRVRLDWFSHVRKCLHEKSFSRKYRMSHRAFNNLVHLLLPYIQRDPGKAHHGSYIIPHLVVAIGVRYLAGDSYNALNDIANISTRSVYRLKHRFIWAISKCESLRIKLPDTATQWEQVRCGFENISSNGLFRGCVGAIDGFFAPIQQPRVADSNGNPMSFMSGHYGMFGLNCQAVCDAREKFLFFGVVAPGKTNDVVAFDYCTKLKEVISTLPYGLFLIGDAAYTSNERLMIPFIGSQCSDAVNDAFNFYLSQVRIRIEMAFARLVLKWHVLCAPLVGSLRSISCTIMACAIMHNYVIDSDGYNEHLELPNDATASNLDFIVRNAPMGMTYLPTMPEFDEEFRISSLTTSHTVQASILQVIEQLNIRRPRHNIERNGIGQGERGTNMDTCYYAPN